MYRYFSPNTSGVQANMKKIKIGLIGAGFIGRSHALAISAVNGVFGDGSTLAVPWVLAEADQAVADSMARKFGFKQSTTDWRQAVAECDAIIIAVPSNLHKEIALYAIEQGKHILCEKPIGLSSSEAQEIAVAAGIAGVSIAVGFTYMRAPLIRHVKQMLDDGAFGAPLHFKGWHCEDYLASPEIPFSWRQDASLAGRCGALGDMGWHILAIARYLCGPVAELSGSVETFHKKRPVHGQPTAYREVENEDWASASLRFTSGARGTTEVSRVAHGKKMDIGFELVCETGSVLFSGERSNEVKLYIAGENNGQAGFRTVRINDQHPDYGNFICAPGHGIGFNDLKTIELRDFLEAISNKRNAQPDIKDAVKISRICEAILESSNQKNWIDSPESFGE